MIKYQYVKVATKGAEYVLVEVLDYDLKEDDDFFDTISYNNNWGRMPILMKDKKVFPSRDAFSGNAKILHAEYLAGGGDEQKLKWVGPFEL